MAATQGTFKLGIGFENWRDRGENYIHSFGLTGKDHWTAGFQHFWLKGRDTQARRPTTATTASSCARRSKAASRICRATA